MDNRIQKYAKFFRAIFIIFFILTPLLDVSIWLAGGEINFGDDFGFSVLDFFEEEGFADVAMPPIPLPMEMRMLGLLTSAIPMGLAMLSLWWLIQLFSCFVNGEIFTQSTVKYIRYLGWTMVAGVIAYPIHDMLLSMVLTMNNPAGEHLVAFSLDGAIFEELVVAGVIILVIWIMEEGRKLRETDELTI